MVFQHRLVNKRLRPSPKNMLIIRQITRLQMIFVLVISHGIYWRWKLSNLIIFTNFDYLNQNVVDLILVC